MLVVASLVVVWLVIDDSSNVYVVCVDVFDSSNVVYLVVLVRLV